MQRFKSSVQYLSGMIGTGWKISIRFGVVARGKSQLPTVNANRSQLPVAG